MMAATRASSVLDVLHRSTVFLLAGSTVYFSVEIGRAWWHLQATKAERQQQGSALGAIEAASMATFLTAPQRLAMQLARLQQPLLLQCTESRHCKVLACALTAALATSSTTSLVCGASGGQMAVRVGIGVIVQAGNEVLIGKRKGSLGHGEYALPGGHLEVGESWEACAQREVLEETGVHIREASFASAVNTIWPESGKHYVTLFMLATADKVTPQLLEPDKCHGWSWVRWQDIPSPCFRPLQQLIDSGYTLPTSNSPPPTANR